MRPSTWILLNVVTVALNFCGMVLSGMTRQWGWFAISTVFVGVGFYQVSNYLNLMEAVNEKQDSED